MVAKILYFVLQYKKAEKKNDGKDLGTPKIPEVHFAHTKNQKTPPPPAFRSTRLNFPAYFSKSL
ncbi:MAG: hypothetical protein D6805_09685 [Planctomycetota bacterium]|nr:MAG: hypothetical protein D6805_09685 [Planctomycetota bacterium]